MGKASTRKMGKTWGGGKGKGVGDDKKGNNFDRKIEALQQNKTGEGNKKKARWLRGVPSERSSRGKGRGENLQKITQESPPAGKEEAGKRGRPRLSSYSSDIKRGKTPMGFIEYLGDRLRSNAERIKSDP